MSRHACYPLVKIGDVDARDLIMLLKAILWLHAQSLRQGAYIEWRVFLIKMECNMWQDMHLKVSLKGRARQRDAQRQIKGLR
jgi:hypothetical protein